MSEANNNFDSEPSDSIQIGIPILIGGSEVVVVRDHIGARLAKDKNVNDVANQVMPAGNDGRPAIFIDESDITTMRNSYPGMKVYGLWQLLFENGRVHLGSEVVIGQTRRSGGSYIRMRPDSNFSDPGNILESGEYVGDRVVSIQRFDLKNAISLDLSIHGLKLPSKPAYSRRELYEQSESQKRRRWINVAAICGLVIAGTAFFNYMQYNKFSQATATYKSQKIELDKQTKILAELKSTRVEVPPKDHATIGAITRLLTLDSGLTTAPHSEKSASSFAAGQSHRLLTSPGLTFDPATAVKGITTKRNQFMQYEITLEQLGARK